MYNVLCEYKVRKGMVTLFVTALLFCSLLCYGGAAIGPNGYYQVHFIVTRTGELYNGYVMYLSKLVN